MSLDPYFVLYTKINSKKIIDLNVEPKSIKLLEGNTGENTCGLELGKNFLHDTKCTVHKKQIDTWYLIKTKKSAYQKILPKRMKRQTTEWMKIFAMHISDKRFISRIYKELSKLNKKKTTQLRYGQTT